MTYSEMLRHPLWQRKRLEVLEHEAFACSVCCDDESPLHVHHRRYIKGRKPWEYEADDLVVLCESCHEEAHAIKDKQTDLFAHIHPMHDADMLAVATSFSVGLPVGCPLPQKDIDRIREAAPLAFTVGCIAALSMNAQAPQAMMDILLRAFLTRKRDGYEFDMLRPCSNYLKGLGAKIPKWAEVELLSTYTGVTVEGAE